MEPTNQEEGRQEVTKLSPLIQIGEGKIQAHLGEVVRSTVEHVSDHKWTKKWTLPRNGRSRRMNSRDFGSQPSHAWEVGSIPIARSINHDDSVDLTRLSYLNST